MPVRRPETRPGKKSVPRRSGRRFTVRERDKKTLFIPRFERIDYLPPGGVPNWIGGKESVGTSIFTLLRSTLGSLLL